MYHTKLIELLSIERVANQSFLHIRFTFGESTEQYWEIDEATAQQLQEKALFECNYKYRLSFKSIFDFTKEQYTISFFKTYKEHSQKVHFTCSEKFITQLNAIKQLEHINQIDSLSFLSINLPIEEQIDVVEQEILQEDKEANEQELIPDEVHTPEQKVLLDVSQITPDESTQEEQVVEQKGNNVQKKAYFGKISWTIATLIIVASILLLGFPGSTLLNQSASLGKKESVNAESVNSDDDVNRVVIKDHTDRLHAEKNPILNSDLSTLEFIKDNEEENILTEETTLNDDKHDLPFVEINEALSFGLPDGKVAITFDDGPSKYSKQIVDILKNYQVGGTFFYIGENVKEYPESVEYVNSQGYTIGSHTMKHSRVTELSFEKQEKEILSSIQLLESIIHEEVDLFRPPFGANNELTLDVMDKHGKKMVLWNSDPKDWSDNTPDQILDYIKGTKVSGSIILLHESEKTINALPMIIEYLQSQNLEIVSLR